MRRGQEPVGIFAGRLRHLWSSPTAALKSNQRPWPKDRREWPKSKKGRLDFDEMNNASSGPGERTTLVRGCLPVLFHVGVLNVERAIGRASDVDSYDDKRKHRSCWTLFAKIE
jgi:hypothetical protein